MLFAAIGLTSPWMLAGLGLLMLPILAHLLNRMSRRRVIFPTVRFLIEAVAAQSRLHRLRRLILLLLRCASVAFLVTAFAEPLWRTAPLLSGTEDQPAAVVVLIDASASTSQTSGGVRLFDALRASADRTLDEAASAGALANVVVASSNPQTIYPELSRNLPGLRGEISSLEPSFERADFLRALSLAGEQLRRHAGRRQCVIVCDFQESNWSDVLGETKLGDLLPENVEIRFVDLEAAVPDNVALSSPTIIPAQPLAGQPAALSCEAANFSGTSKEARVELRWGEQTPLVQNVVLESSQRRAVSFDVTIPENNPENNSENNAGKNSQAGVTGNAEFQIAADGLNADNRAFLAVRSAVRSPVVLLSDEDSDEAGTASYFVSRALAPRGDDGDRYAVERVRSHQLGSVVLDRSAPVLATYLSALQERAAAALVEYVRRGGAVLFFAGEGPVFENLQLLERLSADAQAPVLPWQPGPPLSLRPRESLRISQGKWQSRLLKDFDEQSQVAIGEIPFLQSHTAGPISSTAEVLLSFDAGIPALARQRYGEGQFVLANFSPAAGSSEIAKHGAFVALIQSLVRRLAPEESAGEPNLVGRAYRLVIDREPEENVDANVAPAEIRVVGPDGKPASFSQSVEDGKQVVLIDNPRLPGIYQVHRGDKQIDSIVFQIDPRESDLRRIDRQKLVERFSQRAIGIPVEAVSAFQGSEPLQGRQLWPLCVALAMAAVASELSLLSLWRR